MLAEGSSGGKQKPPAASVYDGEIPISVVPRSGEPDDARREVAASGARSTRNQLREATD
jgi:hypothetical protein